MSKMIVSGGLLPSLSPSGREFCARFGEFGLVDEYHFVVQPVIAGKGRRLLEVISLPEKLQLNFFESNIFKSGSVALCYLKQ